MLDNKTYRLLKLLYRKKRLSYKRIQKITGTDEEKLRSRHILILFENRFINYWETDEIINDLGDRKLAGYYITLEGSAYVEQRKRELYHFWIPYIITTAIALLSLITSLAEHWETVMRWISF